jgi:hypothetical protein
MKVIRLLLDQFLFVAFFATISIAQNGRTFVSGKGADSNPCSLSSPRCVDVPFSFGTGDSRLSLSNYRIELCCAAFTMAYCRPPWPTRESSYISLALIGI